MTRVEEKKNLILNASGCSRIFRIYPSSIRVGVLTVLSMLVLVHDRRPQSPRSDITGLELELELVLLLAVAILMVGESQLT